MNEADRLLGEFIDAWTAGKRPDVADYLDKIDETDRDDLADQLGEWLAIAPTPDYDAATREQIANEPLLLAALAAAAEQRKPLAERMPTLRERAGLSIRELAEKLVATFDLADEPRAAAYLTRLESGELDERRLSHRLLDALAGTLAVEPEWLAPAAAPAGDVFFRSEVELGDAVAEQIDLMSRTAMASSPEGPPLDELDRLFLGGPEG